MALRRPSAQKSSTPAPTCVHCELPLRNKRVHVYMRSGALAHFACVSQVSAEATDDLLVRLQEAPPRKYAYQTEVS